jgi:hypothetical protein
MRPNFTGPGLRCIHSGRPVGVLFWPVPSPHVVYKPEPVSCSGPILLLADPVPGLKTRASVILGQVESPNDPPVQGSHTLQAQRFHSAQAVLATLSCWCLVLARSFLWPTQQWSIDQSHSDPWPGGVSKQSPCPRITLTPGSVVSFYPTLLNSIQR